MTTGSVRATLFIILVITFFSFFPTTTFSQTPVTDVGAGIQREALWDQEKGILSEINWYNVLIKILNGDIKGLTSELVGIDQKKIGQPSESVLPDQRLQAYQTDQVDAG